MTSEMSIIDIDPTWTRDGGWGLDIWAGEGVDCLPSGFKPVEYSILKLSPRTIAANHYHPDPEALLCFESGDNQHGLHIAWLDASGKFNEEPMSPDGQPRLFVIGPNVPHAVMNHSDHNAFGVELRSVPRQKRQVTKQDVFEALILEASK